MKGAKMTRRGFLGRAAAFAATPIFGCRSTGRVGDVYPGWSEGELDIHFIQTGVGEQTFFIFPDGTTMLFDCGDMFRPRYLKHIPRRPNAGKLGGEWVSRYVQRLVKDRTVDYFVLSHWHADHAGHPVLRSEKTSDGRTVCGVTRFAEDFSFRHYFDHQYPDANKESRNIDNPTLEMMLEWIPYMGRRCGMQPHKFEIGATNQIALLRGGREKYPEFSISNLFADGRYWNGSGISDIRPRYRAERPESDGVLSENTRSLGIRIAYGKFRAYFGGDIDVPWHEALLAPMVGPVDVCKMNHHGCPSSMGADFCRAVRAQAYISSIWSPNQVAHQNLVNMTSRELYPGDRRIMPGYLPQVKRDEYSGKPFMRDFLPVQGHSVFKVAPGGGSFDLFVLTDEDESMTILHSERLVSGANA